MPLLDRNRSLGDVIDAVAQGHPKLLALLSGFAAGGLPGETPDAPTRAVIYLDDFGVRGELAWKLIAENCGGDVCLFLGVSLGALTPSGLRLGIEEDLLDVEAVSRYSARVEAHLRRHARAIAGSLPVPQRNLVYVGEGELVDVLRHFFATPPAAAGHDEES
jgi:hypothetical protein